MKLSLLYSPESLSRLTSHPALLLYIFEYLPITALCNLSCASKLFNALSSHPVLWSLSKFELRSWISEKEYEFLDTLPAKEQWQWCFQTFVYGQFVIGLSRNSRVRVPETCVLCQKSIKPLVLRWERRRTVRDQIFVAPEAELINDQELLYFHWDCVEPPARFVTHYQVPGYSSLTFDAKQAVREYFDKRQKANEKQLRKAKENPPFAIVCDHCDRLCGETVYQCMPHDDCHLCMKCYRLKSTPLREQHAQHGTFEKQAYKQQHFNCNNCKKSIKDFFFFCRDCPDGLYLCANCFRRSRTRNHDESHCFYSIGNSSAISSEGVLVHPAVRQLELGATDNDSESQQSGTSSDSRELAMPSQLDDHSQTPRDSPSVVRRRLRSSRSASTGAGTSPLPLDRVSEVVLKNEDMSTSTTPPLAEESSSNDDSRLDASDSKKRKSASPFAKKRPKKMRRFDELNRKVKENFALRYFIDLGVDIDELVLFQKGVPSEVVETLNTSS